MNHLDINRIYKHGPKCMLNELSTIELLYIGNNLVVYRYIGSNIDRSMSKDHWLEYSHIVE